MQKLHFEISINAPKTKVWISMLSDKTYRQWTEAFSPGSHFEGNWEKGSTIKFLSPDSEGNLGGMYCKVVENRTEEFISMELMGEIKDGKEVADSDEAKKWAGGHENYTFTEKNGITLLSIDTDSTDELKPMFEKMWPDALKKLKELCEKPAEKITVETIVKAPIEKVWAHWNEPEHIIQWAHASDDWEAPSAENDLRTGGSFKTVMAAKNKSFSFDFVGTYTEVKTNELIEYDIADGRHVKIQFSQVPEGVKVTETFDMENQNPMEMQKNGWQSILDNFRKYTEAD